MSRLPVRSEHKAFPGFVSQDKFMQMKIKAFCTSCKCKGVLYKRKKDGGITFVPDISPKQTHVYRQNRRSWLRIESHGFGTLQQQASLVIWGSLFLSGELQFGFKRNELHPWIQKAKQLSLPDPAKTIPFIK